MNIGLGYESNSTVGGVERGDDLPGVAVDLDHQAVGRGKVGHGFKVADPVVKLLGDGVGNDGAEQSEGQHDEGDEADEEPPDQVVRTQELQQVRFTRDPGADDAHVVVSVVINSKVNPDRKYLRTGREIFLLDIVR